MHPARERLRSRRAAARRDRRHRGFLIIVTLGGLYIFAYTERKGVEAVDESRNLLTFQSSAAAVNDPFGDLLFFAAPIIGLVLVTQGAISFGRRLADKRGAAEVVAGLTGAQLPEPCHRLRAEAVGLRVATHLIEAGYEVVGDSAQLAGCAGPASATHESSRDRWRRH